MVRRPAAAGSFYPARPAALEAELARLLGLGEGTAPARAVVVPHAGWTYSGTVSGAVYRRVAIPRVVIVVGPNHRGHGAAAAIGCRGRWAIPGGEVPIASDLAAAILAGSHVLREDDAAHAIEHSIEVQLPFLRRLRPDLTFVPIGLWRQDLEACRDVGKAVAAAVRASAEPVLVVCSTDLDHYEPRAVSERKDRLAIDAMLALDPERLLRTVTGHDISMCGVAAAAATLAALRELGSGTGELVRYATSGDVTGDDQSVVGYAGLIFHPAGPSR